MQKRKRNRLEAATWEVETPPAFLDSSKAKSSDIAQHQLAEVRRRVAEVESGEAELIPGDEVMVRVRNLISALEKET